MTAQYLRSERVTDLDTNGGRRGYDAVVYGAARNLLPRVEDGERQAGVSARYRKMFFHNSAADNSTKFDATVFVAIPTPAGDRVYIGRGTHDDEQSDVSGDPPIWTGGGQLAAALSGSETAVQIAMEAADFGFYPGSYLYISDAFMTSQTVDSDVQQRDAVSWDGSKWTKRTPDGDNVYPNGTYCGSGRVHTIQTGTNEQRITLPSGLTEDEDIGTGDGSATAPVLSDLANAANGLFTNTGYLPVITATCGGVERTVTVEADGTCTGYCSAGELNMTDGTWTTDITWTTAPDNATDILATYYAKFWSWSGNTVTVTTTDQVANAYATASTWVSGCFSEAEVKTETTDWTETSASGTFDESTYPLILDNTGTVADEWTLTFSNSTTFSVSGVKEGNVGTGTISGDFAPTNPNNSAPYFTLDADGWGGSWTAGDTITFKTVPSDLGIWVDYVAPAGMDADYYNFCLIKTYYE